MNRCRLCGVEASLVKSHIIPEAFFRELRSDGAAPLLVPGREGELPRRAPIGVYDPTMLCGSCEAKFGPIDSYGATVLLTQFDRHFVPLQQQERTVAFEGVDIDTERLLRFLVSVLWRASVSSRRFYDTVNLGPHEQIAKACMLDHPIPGVFNAVLSRWDDSEDGSHPTTGLMNPIRERWGDVNAYRLYLGRVVAYVKVDKREFAEPISSLSLQAGPPCRIVNRRLSRSKDLQAMKKTIFAAERNRRQLRRRYGST